MKYNETSTQDKNEYIFHRQKLNKSPINKSNSNFITNDFNNNVVISKLEINFPKMKYCQSKRDINDGMIQNQGETTNERNRNKLELSPIQKRQNYQNYPFNKNKIQRSPTQFNQYSYQQTTKEDYSQNLSSYNDFYRISASHQNSDKKSIVPQNKQPLKQKQTMLPQPSLSQLLNDLQNRSQKLYEIFGQNSQNYQKCIYDIQKNKKQQYKNSQQKEFIKSSYKLPQMIKKNQQNQYKVSLQQKLPSLIKSPIYKSNLSLSKIVLTKQERKQQTKNSQKKKKVIFYTSVDEEHEVQTIKNFNKQTKLKQILKFNKNLNNFFRKYFINTLRTKLYYQTGVLSTQSIIHSPIKGRQNIQGRSIETLKSEKQINKSQKEVSKSQKQTSFFVEYFNSKKRPDQPSKNEIQVDFFEEIDIPQQLIVQQQNNKLTTNQIKDKQKVNYKVQGKETQIQNNQYYFGLANKRLQLNQVSQQQLQKKKELSSSLLNRMMNENKDEKPGSEQLLIQSKNGNFFGLKNNQDFIKEDIGIISKEENSKFTKKALKILQKMNKAFTKVEQIMKYKILTIVRFVFLVIKLKNYKQNDNNSIISSLKKPAPQLKQTNSKIKNTKNSYKKELNIEKRQENTQKHSKLKIQTNVIKTIKSNSPQLQNKKKGSKIIENKNKSPRNILDHYYKKVSSPNSPSNEYASIVEINPKESRIMGNNQKMNLPQSVGSSRIDSISNQHHNLQNNVQHQYPSNRAPLDFQGSSLYNKSYNNIQHQEYYRKHQNNPNHPNNPINNVHISRQRNVRALSSDASKYFDSYHIDSFQHDSNQFRDYDHQYHEGNLIREIRQVNIHQQPHIKPPQISKNSMLKSSMMRSSGSLPRDSRISSHHFSPYNSNLMTGKQQSHLSKGIHQSQQNSKLTNRIPQNPSTFQSNLYPHLQQVNPNRNSQQLQQIRKSEYLNQRNYLNGHPTDQASSLNKFVNGKISRSYSENDFQLYYQQQQPHTQHNIMPRHQLFNQNTLIMHPHISIPNQNYSNNYNRTIRPVQTKSRSYSVDPFVSCSQTQNVLLSGVNLQNKPYIKYNHFNNTPIVNYGGVNYNTGVNPRQQVIRNLNIPLHQGQINSRSIKSKSVDSLDFRNQYHKSGHGNLYQVQKGNHQLNLNHQLNHQNVLYQQQQQPLNVPFNQSNLNFVRNNNKVISPFKQINHHSTVQNTPLINPVYEMKKQIPLKYMDTHNQVQNQYNMNNIRETQPDLTRQAQLSRQQNILTRSKQIIKTQNQNSSNQLKQPQSAYGRNILYGIKQNNLVVNQQLTQRQSRFSNYGQS